MAIALTPVDSFDFVIFGGTGDLALRKLVPALFHRFHDGQLPADSRIVGAARDTLDDERYRARLRAALEERLPAAERPTAVLDAFLQLVHFVPLDVAADRGWAPLAELLGQAPQKVRVFYLAISPTLYRAACERLCSRALINALCRVVVEKPLGNDLATAHAINETLAAAFSEAQTFRIDHYLGKETVQNLTALRFGNALFEPLWNAAHIDHVQITVSEQVGVGGRHSYYDSAGALRDMVQNHLLQLLCFVAIEPPPSMHADALRDEKIKVLRALVPLTGERAVAATVRGQYRAGQSSAVAVPGYNEENGGTAGGTETFVALRAEIANWRWAGVPFYLRTGKRLAARLSEIVICFRPVPHSIFDQQAGALRPNKLVIRLQPDEGMRLWLMMKQPGPGGLRLRSTSLDMTFAEAFGGRHSDAYERLLLDVVRGNPALFMRRDEVEAAWSWIDPIRAAWSEADEAPRPYPAGSWGPSAAFALIERDGRTWHEDEDPA